MSPRAGATVCLLLLVVPVLGLGCRTTYPGRDDPFERGVKLAIDDPRVVDGLASLVARTEVRQSLVASASLALDGPELRGSRPQRLAVQRPASLRVELLGLFGQIAAILVTDGVSYEFWDGRATGTTGGEVTREMLWRVAQVDLLPAEAVELLLGDPTAGRAVTAIAAVESREGRVTIALAADGADAGKTIVLGPAGELLRALRYDRAGRLLWDASFTDYREAAGDFLAHDIEIKFPRFEATAHFHLKQASLNPELSPSAFQLDPR